MNDEIKNIEFELESGLNIRKKQKMLGIRLIITTLIFIPVLLTLFFIGIHSNRLITASLLNIIGILLALFISLILFGLFLHIINYRIHIVLYIKNIYKYLYILVLSILVVNSMLFIYIFYGPMNSIKAKIVKFAISLETYKEVIAWIYSDEEIEYILNQKEGF